MDAHELFFESLTAEEEQLIIIRDFLYEGDWSQLTADLEARRAGKPFIFKLNTRIEEDLERIEKLESYEEAHSVDLGEYLARSGKYPELSGAFGEPEREEGAKQASGVRTPGRPPTHGGD